VHKILIVPVHEKYIQFKTGHREITNRIKRLQEMAEEYEGCGSTIEVSDFETKQTLDEPLDTSLLVQQLIHAYPNEHMAVVFGIDNFRAMTMTNWTTSPIIRRHASVIFVGRGESPEAEVSSDEWDFNTTHVGNIVVEGDPDNIMHGLGHQVALWWEKNEGGSSGCHMFFLQPLPGDLRTLNSTSIRENAETSEHPDTTKFLDTAKFLVEHGANVHGPNDGSFVFPLKDSYYFSTAKYFADMRVRGYNEVFKLEPAHDV